MSPAVAFDVVVPTVGRESLANLLAALESGEGPSPQRIVVVDDRIAADAPLPFPRMERLGERLVVVPGGGRGPAAARNAGWRAARAPWVAFLDDDVLPPPRWRAELAADLAAATPDVAASQGRIVVPLPADRRPTDWERNVHGLERARWATADMAYRRAALAAVGGFDERFPRAYREDADLALRVVRRGWRIARGDRHVLHPVRPASPWISLRLQRGNADDVLMRALHGRDWRRAAGAGRGRLPRHLVATAAAVTAVAAAALHRRRTAALASAAWLLGTGELAAARIAPGPRTPGEIAAMVVTSLAMPPFAASHWLRGWLALPRLLRDRDRAPRPLPARPGAVLFDRDGTLVHDVPYNGDPDRVEPVAGAREALDRLRRAGVRVGIVSNQSGVARGLLSDAQLAAVNARVDALLGPFDTVVMCTHAPGAGCDCRKPRPGMVLRAARDLGVDVGDCVVVGDIAADVQAAAAAGAAGVLVPNGRTRAEEVRRAALVAHDVGEAVDLVLGAGA